MLTITIFLPLAVGLALLVIPSAQAKLIRYAALAGSLLTLLLTLILWGGYDPTGSRLQWRTVTDWIPSIGSSYDVAVDGLSLPLIVLTALLLSLSMLYVLPEKERAKEHAFLFLLMATGLIGLFAAQDLLLFYLFFEVGLVPMYFIVGIWGGENRRYAALKFFLYTRAGSLAMLLSFLALYLATGDSGGARSFSLSAITAAQPFVGQAAGFWVLLGLLLGFGVKLPTVPLHNWLPDAHVEAPTEGSVMLAGIQLKMGAYGLLRVLIPTLPEAVQEYAWLLMVLALVSLIYGALAALPQRDLKRLIAYTSVNHMGYVMLGVAVWGLSSDTGVKQLALNGAVLQMISHGLLTGGMFFLAGILQHQAGTREMARFGGLLGRVPLYSGLLGLLAFGSLGLPALSGFVAEFQVLGATLAVSPWLAVLALVGLIVTTGLYLKILNLLLMGSPPDDMPEVREMKPLEASAVIPLAALSLGIGILPGPFLAVIERSTQFLAQLGG